LSASTGSWRRRLPVIEFQASSKIGDLCLKLTLLAAIFDRAAKCHAALVFLLTTGFDRAVAFFVDLGHFESPKSSTGVSR
jgi:hypothetical protein